LSVLGAAVLEPDEPQIEGCEDRCLLWHLDVQAVLALIGWPRGFTAIRWAKGHHGRIGLGAEADAAVLSSEQIVHAVDAGHVCRRASNRRGGTSRDTPKPGHSRRNGERNCGRIGHSACAGRCTGRQHESQRQATRQEPCFSHITIQPSAMMWTVMEVAIRATVNKYLPMILPFQSL